MTLKQFPFVLAFSVLFSLVAVAQAPVPASLGPKPGSVAPAFTAVDQFGRPHTLQSLLDRDGLMLVFFRSADW